MGRSEHTEDMEVQVDERWIAEWVDFGFLEIETYLRRQAQFAAYLRLRMAAGEL
ncbi:MAG TPA: hypothetical protein VFH74_13585 [Gaiellales bacterium]|jgi:predicted nucleic-acid-binding protein|nr:hypothetical protein [Gaiellales bacterium]